MQFRDLETQYQVLKRDIDEDLLSAVSDGRYISGPQVNELEAALAEYVGVKHCITCGNGTDALQLALMVWGVGVGDVVFVPDFTFFASGEVPALLGATPVFVDVDERTFNIDSSKLEEAILYIIHNTTLKPRVVIAVDLFGLPANYPVLKSICERYGLLLLEDGAQGFGGEINDQRACSFGDISCTSFFPAKPLGCFGDGGAVFTNNDDWSDLVRSYAVHGKGSMKYDNVRLGINSRLDTLQAAILRVKLIAFRDYEVVDVNKVAGRYAEELSGFQYVLPQVPKGYLSSWAQYTIQLPESVSRTTIQEYLKDRDIPTVVYYPKPMHEQLAFAGKLVNVVQGICVDGCPTTKRLCKTVLSLPMGPYVTDQDVSLVAAALRRFAE